MAENVNVDVINNYPDWMSKAYDSLKNMKLCQMPLPGSHDAGAYGNIATRSMAQGLDVKRQLLAGFRYFDFRVCVNDGVFYAVHGGDSTDNNYAAIQSKRKGVGPKFIFQDIHDFCVSYPKELVILHFSHFVGSGGQNFNAKDDQPDFSNLIREYFGNMLVTAPGKDISAPVIPTYGACVGAGQRVLAIVDNDDCWTDQDMKNLWSTRRCFRDRYSDKYFDWSGGAAFDNLQAKIDYTLDDQEEYLKTGGSDHRDLNKFWVTQAVLNYAAVPHDGKSQNYWGAKSMNLQFVKAYQNWWQGKTKAGAASSKISKPNVLLMDYAGYFLPQKNDPLLLF